MTEPMAHLTMSIEADLRDLLRSVSRDNQLNVSELIRESVRFALSSRSFHKRLNLTLDSADPMINRCIGHTSISIRTLMKRLVRRADVVADNTSSALTVIRLKRSGLTGEWWRHFDARKDSMGQEETRMKKRTMSILSSDDARHTPEIRSDLEEWPW